MSQITRALLIAGLVTAASIPMAEAASPTQVKFTTPSPAVTVSGISQFDWQSTGDLVIDNDLPYEQTLISGVKVTTFADWAAGAQIGDLVDINIHAHARLNAFLNKSNGAISVPRLSRNGSTCLAGSNCFEVTAAVSATEHAQLIEAGVLKFLGFNGGDVKFFVGPPNSNVTTPDNPAPTNFIDGTAFLAAELQSVTGQFTFNVGGSNYVTSAITAYDKTILGIDNTLNNPPLDTLTNASFDTLVQIPPTVMARISLGQHIGLLPYQVAVGDLIFKGDANGVFLAKQTPQELEGCRVTGGGRDETDQHLIIANNANQPFAVVGGATTNTSLTSGYPAFDPSNRNDYTSGGQAGAPTVNVIGKMGEWTHHQKDGPAGDFVFHAGAPNPKQTDVTFIQAIACSDPPACEHAKANGKFKQIDFEGIGEFNTVKPTAGKYLVDGFEVVPKPKGPQPAIGSLHYFRVHIEDLGENKNLTDKDLLSLPTTCTSHVPGTIMGDNDGVASNGSAVAECTDCPDIYQIEIHETSDRTSPVIYTVGGYQKKGNYQIHEPTGNPLNP